MSTLDSDLLNVPIMVMLFLCFNVDMITRLSIIFKENNLVQALGYALGSCVISTNGC